VAFYLGIDGGGTKTACAVGDDTSLLATAIGGPSNIVRVGDAVVRESLRQTVAQVCAAAGITPQQIEYACMGAAGAGRFGTADSIRNILAEIVEAEIQVVGDGPIALEAAFGSGPGVIVIAGTGSIAYGRDAQGNTARSGGWGFAVSDEGSAHWIGRSVIAALLQAMDERGEAEGMDSGRGSAVWSAVRKAWGIGTLADLVRTANSSPPPDFAALFPAILAAVDDGDAVALHVLTQAGKELAGLAAIVIARLYQKTETGPAHASDVESSVSRQIVRLAMAGGVFRHAARLREFFYNEIRKLHPQVILNPQVVDPVHGALQLARKSRAQAAKSRT